jgi:hypothetical protein
MLSASIDACAEEKGKLILASNAQANSSNLASLILGAYFPNCLSPIIFGRKPNSSEVRHNFLRRLLELSVYGLGS